MPDQPRESTEPPHRRASKRSTPQRWTRRNALAQGLTLASTAMLGCNREPNSVASQTSPSRPRVPLRILVVGEASSADSLARAWDASHDDALAIEVVTAPRAESARMRDEALTRTSNADVIIFPLLLIGDLFAEQLVVDLDLKTLQDKSVDESSDLEASLPPAVRTGLARFADQSIALPLGGIIPAVFSVEPIDSIKTWGDYDTLVADTWRGEASEPTSPGWAAAMFLWRAMSAARDGWLFDRETLNPLLATRPYVETLQQMLQTHARYKTARQSPGDIWDRLQQGSLRGGITFPPSLVDAFPDVQVTDMPGGNAIQRVLFDPFTPLAAIAAACRQSSLAKRFLGWLVSPDGTAALGQSIAGVKQVNPPSQSIADRTANRSPYDRWLDKVWATPLSSPTLQLINGGAYYHTLDAEIGKALDGKTKPDEALKTVAEQWRAISKKVGVDTQIRVWHQSQGRRG